MNDWELVSLAQSGDLTAFTALVCRYQQPVIDFFLHMIASREDAEDLAQEAFVQLHRYVNRLTPRAKFSTFLFGIARHLALNHIRDSKRRGRDKAESLNRQTQEMPSSHRADVDARIHEIRVALESGLQHLSPEHREVLLLREFQEMEYADIARVLRCNKGTVKSRIARARGQLKAHLELVGVDL